MSGTLSKYILEDEEAHCYFPDADHCPIRCISRNYSHYFIRFQCLERSIKEMKETLDMVLEYVTRHIDDSDSEAEKIPKKKPKTKSRNPSPTASEEAMNRELKAAQAALERDFSQLLTWKDSDDEGGKPKKPKHCQPLLKTNVSSDDDDTSEESEDEAISTAGEIVNKVSQVIDDMAKMVDEIQVTAGIAVQMAADAAEEAQKIAEYDDSDEDSDSDENDEGNEDDEGNENDEGNEDDDGDEDDEGNEDDEEDEGNEDGEDDEEDEGNEDGEDENEDESEPEFFCDFLALYNEMNEVD